MVLKGLPDSFGAHKPQTQGRRERPSVLVVDDDPGLQNLLQLILSRDYDVQTATNGREALDYIDRSNFDVIVLDLRMPVLDGPEFFRKLRARGHATPVLITSSYGARSAQQELGAEGAILKPFDPDALLRAMSSLVR